MALYTNATTTYDQIGIREDLVDKVYRIDPEETPFLSNISRSVKVTNRYHEWQTQGLTAPAYNAQLEGDVANAGPVKVRVRIGNRTQISKKVYAVTGTSEEVIVAGIADELIEQRLLKKLELKRDMELVLLDNTVQQSGGTTTARNCAGLATYITNWDAGVTLFSIADGLGTAAWNFAAATTTCARALSLSQLNTSNYQAWIDGGKPNVLLLSGDKKIDFSQLALTATSGAVQLRFNIPPGMAKFVTAVEGWQSDFGPLEVVPDPQMDLGTFWEQRTVYLVDSRYVGVGFLGKRNMLVEPLAKTGDASPEHVLSEYTLQVSAPSAHALVPNLNA